MKATARLLPVLLFCIALPACPSQALASELSPQQYSEQIKDFLVRADGLEQHPEQAGDLLTAIPDTETLRDGNRELVISFRSLKDELTSFHSNPQNKADRLSRIRTYLQRLESEAESYEQRTDADSDRTRLNAILAASEFRNVHAPGLKERLLSRLYRWLGRLLMRFMLSGSADSSLVQVLVYFLLAIALVLVVVWTVRQFRRPRDEVGSREIIPFSPSAKNWRSWLAEAREFAAKNDWRNAIHMAYWAGISFLESGGAWKPDRARTPREYLRLINAYDPNFPPLSTLTRKFEVVWYGDRAARQTDFEETLQHLERLGCR